MYKYKCTAEVNADKEAFYGVIGGLKALYPEMFENSNAPSDNEFLRREFWQGKNRVLVQYSFSERSVTVFSEDWLGKFYEDREVAEGRFHTYSAMSTGTMWQLSGIFFAVMVAASFVVSLVVFNSWNSEKNIIITILISAAVYTISGIIIRRHIDIPLINLFFCQLGGFITVGVGVFAANILLLELLFSIYFFMPIIELLLIFAVCILLVFLPASEISFLIQAIIGYVMKKVHSSKTVAEENIAENDE